MDAALTPVQARLSWTLTLLTGAYVAATSIALSRNGALMRTFFEELGAQVGPAPEIALTLATPLVFGPLGLAVVAFLVVKELKIRSVVTRGLTSMVVFVAWACIVAAMLHALDAPMRDLITRIG